MDQPTPVHEIDLRLRAMPPARALALRLAAYDGDSLVVAAPLAPNVNDKGNAFGGSLASAATLAAWALCSVKLLEAGFDADVYVQDTSIRYLAPLYDDLQAIAKLAEHQSWDGFLAAFAQKGKARATLAAQLRGGDGTVACALEGRFVAKVRPAR